MADVGRAGHPSRGERPDPRFADRVNDRSGPIEWPTGPGREVVLSPGGRRPGAPRADGHVDDGDRPELAPPGRDLVPVRASLPAVSGRVDPHDDPDGDDVDGDDAPDDGRSFGQAWASFVGQIIAASVGGLAVWLGFQALWRRWPYGAAAAAAAVLVIILLGGHHVHRRRHPDEPPDMVTVGILVIVGLVLTISPAAFVLRPI